MVSAQEVCRMGIFDSFIKEKSPTEKKAEGKTKVYGFTPTSKKDGGSVPPSGGNEKLKTFKPQSFDDVCKIIDVLLLDRPVVVNLEAVRDDTMQRVIDILSGACYALHGGIEQITENVFTITPDVNS